MFYCSLHLYDHPDIDIIQYESRKQYRVGQKRLPPRFFANILTKSKNFQMKFYRLIDNSYLHIMARFHQNISNGTKVTSLLVRSPTVFWRFKNEAQKKLGFLPISWPKVRISKWNFTDFKTIHICTWWLDFIKIFQTGQKLYHF